MSTGDGFYHHHLSWNDDLTVPFTALPGYVAAVRAGTLHPRPTEHLRRERERIASGYRDLLRTSDEKAAFDQMLGLCRLVFPFVEDHKFYCEHHFTTRFFQKVKAFGALLARQGVIDEADDVFHLHHTEIDQALSDVSLAWAAGSPPLGGRHFPPVIAERKRMLEVLRDWSPPPALGPVPEALNDPAVRMLWGVTQERIEQWLNPDPDELRGVAASPGVVEGVARVLHDVNQVGELRQGEILVCPVTAPSWAPVFTKIKAAVSDIGGAMSHAAIVAREYGMPAVVGTGDATKRIRTGDMIRVDGDRGTVLVAERVPAFTVRRGSPAGSTAVMTSVVPLPQAEDAAIVGGKGASLGELLRAGIPVPPGFAVTVSAFQAAMAAIDPGGRQRAGIEALDASDLSAIMTTTAAFRDAVTAAPVPDSVAAAITAAYAALGGGTQDPDVAVRSSATLEDSAAASFAGLQDTYLSVRGPGDVLDRVRRCWASLYNDESVAYRRRIGLPEQSLSMAVVVQVMVRPRAAGVMFTRSPVTGDRSVVAIEGTWGLGPALVAGAVTPDSFTVSKITGEITARRISAKATITPLNPRRAPAHRHAPRPARTTPASPTRRSARWLRSPAGSRPTTGPRRTSSGRLL